MFRNMRIGWRLSIGFALILGLLTLSTVVGVQNLEHVNKGTDKIVERDWVKAKLITQALDNLRGSMARVFQLTMRIDAKESAHAEERLRANIKAFTEALDKVDGLIYRPEGKALMVKIKETRARYLAGVEKTLALLAEGKR